MESLAVEFCAFTVAIAVELHPWTELDTRKQWNPEQLSLEIAVGPYGDSVNLKVNSEALHQGLYIFKRALNNLRHEIVQMGGNKSVMSIFGFMELFDLMANGFREPKFVQGVVRSFISTGCMPVYSTDPDIINFSPYTKHKMSGTMNILAPTTATSESAEVLEAMYNMLDYDSDDEATAAMRYILDYNADSSVTD